jgi:hypothetical protein
VMEVTGLPFHVFSPALSGVARTYNPLSRESYVPMAACYRTWRTAKAAASYRRTLAVPIFVGRKRVGQSLKKIGLWPAVLGLAW